MILHDLKDLVSIYYSNPDGKTDYTWDKTPINVWNPKEQCEMDIYFTGSKRPGCDGPNDPGQINFNVSYKDEHNANSAAEQKNIDIKNACDYLERYTYMFISPSGFLDVENFIKDFVATMNRE